MKLDRTMILAMGLAAAGLLTLGLTLGTERSSTRGPPMPAAPPAERACVTVAAEHAAPHQWAVGYGLMSAKVQNTGGRPVSLRNILRPGTAYDDPVFGKDPLGATMDELYTGPKDHGGVHYNAGIPARAAAEPFATLTMTTVSENPRARAASS